MLRCLTSALQDLDKLQRERTDRNYQPEENSWEPPKFSTVPHVRRSGFWVLIEANVSQTEHGAGAAVLPHHGYARQLTDAFAEQLHRRLGGQTSRLPSFRAKGGFPATTIARRVDHTLIIARSRNLRRGPGKHFSTSTRPATGCDRCQNRPPNYNDVCIVMYE